MTSTIAGVDRTKRIVVKGFRSYARLTGVLRVLPDFLIIGTQKGGTTSLSKYLSLHPDVVKSRGELHFFDNNFYQDLNWYRSHFPLLAHQKFRIRGPQSSPAISGEGSPYYLYHPLVPQRVREVLPNVKLIALLRNPVERAYSHYMHNVRKGIENLATFEEALAAEAGRLEGERERLIADEHFQSHSHRHYSYLARGVYADQLNEWFKFIPREQFMIIRSEDFYGDTSGAFKQVTDFLEISTWEPVQYAKHNSYEYSSMSSKTRARLTDYFAPYNKRLSELLNMDFSWG